MLSRRQFLPLAAAAPASLAAAGGFQFRYVLASCLYGLTPLDEVLGEVKKTGAEWIDIWPRIHADQREQMEAMGHEKFAALLHRHGVKLGILTHYDLGPFDLQSEMRVAKKLGGKMIVCGGKGPHDLSGPELKAAVADFLEQMKPHLAVAEETGVTIAIENHGNNLIDSPDSIKWLAELSTSPNIGIALAPYHLPQDPSQIASLIETLGERMVLFYAWQHGQGSTRKMPKADELQQMPGRGGLDFAPIVAALRRTRFAGWTSIFMHPFPRGIAIHETTAEVTAEVNQARSHLEALAL